MQLPQQQIWASEKKKVKKHSDPKKRSEASLFLSQHHATAIGDGTKLRAQEATRDRITG